MKSNKFKIEGVISSETVLEKLETINLSKINNIMLQGYGSIDNSILSYTDLTNKELVKEVVKIVKKADVKLDTLKVYDKPILTLLGDMSKYSFRIYFGCIETTDDFDMVDFCMDVIPENEEEFNAVINSWT